MTELSCLRPPGHTGFPWEPAPQTTSIEDLNRTERPYCVIAVDIFHALALHVTQPFELKIFLKIMCFHIKIHACMRDSVRYDRKLDEHMLGCRGDARLGVRSVTWRCTLTGGRRSQHSGVRALTNCPGWQNRGCVPPRVPDNTPHGRDRLLPHL